MRKLSFDEILAFRSYASSTPGEVSLERWQEMAFAAFDDLAEAEGELSRAKDERDVFQDAMTYWGFEMNRLKTKIRVVKDQIKALRARLP